jgi:hypothetical protein
MEVNGVEFQDEEFEVRARPLAPKKKTMGEWLIEKKIAKNPLQANTALLIVIIVCIIASGVALYVNALRPAAPSHSLQIKAMQMYRQQPYAQ